MKMSQSYSSSGFGIRIIILSIAVYAAAWLLPGVTINSFWAAIGTAFVISILDSLVRPIILVVTLPATILSLGLFTFINNALLLLMADGIVKGLDIQSFGWAILFSLLITFFNYLLDIPNRKIDTYTNQQQNNPQLNPNDENHFDDYEEVE